MGIRNNNNNNMTKGMNDNMLFVKPSLIQAMSRRPISCLWRGGNSVKVFFKVPG